MLFLLFQLGRDRYALDATQVVEVLPLVNIRKLLAMPPGVAGAFNYRGVPVPVLDLSELALGQTALRRLTTRIILVHHSGAGGDRHLIGLIAEKATETVRRELADFVSAGIANGAAPCLGAAGTHAQDLVQLVDVDQLLPPPVRRLLFEQTAQNRC